MPRKTLTIAAVDRIKPPDKGQVEHFDLGYPGLALRVSYAGAKSWRFSYRFGGLPRRICLGTYPAVGLIEARDAWRAARQSIAKGIDPAARNTANRTDTFATVVAEWIKRDKADAKASTIRQLENTVAFDLLPAWGTRRVDQITKRDVIELLDRITDRGAPAQARKIFVRLSRFFRWCHGREIVIINPMSGLERPGSESERNRVLTDAEVVKVWNACGNDPCGAAARLLLLTGARREEVCQLKWSEIDGDIIRLASERTKGGKPHTIPLSAPARALLEVMPKIGEFVFTFDGKRPINNWSRAKTKIDEAAGIEPWVIHDLRRTADTGMNELGVEPHIVEAILGHAVKGVAGVYNRAKYEASKRSALEAWGAHITDLV